LYVIQRTYKVKFDGKGLRVVGSKMLAYTDALNDAVAVGTRIIGKYIFSI